MNYCEFYGGTEKITATSTRIKCRKMEDGSKVYENKDPEGAMIAHCCWSGGKDCPHKELHEEENNMNTAEQMELDASEQEQSQQYSSTAAITTTERQEKAMKLHRQVLANGKIAADCMVAMGRDLKVIKDEKLFSEFGCENFEEYCEQKVGIGKRHGYNFIQVYERFG